MKIPQKPPGQMSLPKEFLTQGRFRTLMQKGPLDAKGRYLHWDQLRHRPPPEGLTVEEVWAGMRLARKSNFLRFELTSSKSKTFGYVDVDPIRKALHFIDRRAAGHISTDEAVINKNTQSRYLVRSLIEEAYSSSVLEGAATTRQAAKEIIRERREPVDESERMVLNNYNAIQFIRGETDQDLTPELILQIHKIVTERTLEDAALEGAFRDATHNVDVIENSTSEVLHVPPDASEIGDRIEELCAFANQGDDTSPFVHPIVRAIIIHFMLAHIHPFVDGNGRTARALFYWSALRSGYWVLEYVSISNALRRAPTKYGQAFLYTETDDDDLTYFILHQLDVLESLLNELKAYLAKRALDIESLKKSLERTGLKVDLNHRQIQLLEDSVRHPGALYTIASHSAFHDVSYLTARADLDDLYKRSFFRRLKEGKTYVFTAKKSLVGDLSKGSGLGSSDV